MSVQTDKSQRPSRGGARKATLGVVARRQGADAGLSSGPAGEEGKATADTEQAEVLRLVLRARRGD